MATTLLEKPFLTTAPETAQPRKKLLSRLLGRLGMNKHVEADATLNVAAPMPASEQVPVATGSDIIQSRFNNLLPPPRANPMDNVAMVARHKELSSTSTQNVAATVEPAGEVAPTQPVDALSAPLAPATFANEATPLGNEVKAKVDLDQRVAQALAAPMPETVIYEQVEAKMAAQNSNHTHSA
jgi:hypothetical protein